jgi:hypothetical protein
MQLAPIRPYARTKSYPNQGDLDAPHRSRGEPAKTASPCWGPRAVVDSEERERSTAAALLFRLRANRRALYRSRIDPFVRLAQDASFVYEFCAFAAGFGRVRFCQTRYREPFRLALHSPSETRSRRCMMLPGVPQNRRHTSNFRIARNISRMQPQRNTDVS